MKALRLLIFLMFATEAVCQAQITTPGWYRATNAAVAPTGAAPSSKTKASFHPSIQFQPLAQPQPSVPIAEAITPEIQALADGLQDNPTNIFNYVHDHIKFILYFGSKKGANLTLLEKSGNDFDQCALLVALLSAAGYSNSVQYEFGWQEIPYDDPHDQNYDIHHWWQLTLPNTNWDNTIQYITDLTVVIRGYPLVYYVTDGENNNFYIQRTWVQLTIGSTAYQLDPAFKISEFNSGLQQSSEGSWIYSEMAAGNLISTSNSLMSAAGGTDTGTYAQNLSESAVRNQMTNFSTRLLNDINFYAANNSMQQILGGWQILAADDSVDFTSDTLFPEISSINGNSMPALSWTYEPTNMMSTLSISFSGTNYHCFMPQLQGDRLSLTYNSNGVAQLWQDDNMLAQGSNTRITNTFVNYLETRFAFGLQGDNVVFTNCTGTAEGISPVTVAFENISATLLVSQPITNATTISINGKTFDATPTVPGTGGYYQTTLTRNDPSDDEYTVNGGFTGFNANVGKFAQSNSFVGYYPDNVTLTVTHPVGTWNTSNNTFVPNPANGFNSTVTNPYQSTNSSYAIMYAFEPDWGWLQERENKLDSYLAEGLTNTSRQVTCETLNIMGLNWMLQTENCQNLIGDQLGILPMYYHRLGRMGQELDRGYYVDVYMQITGEYPNSGDDPPQVELSNEYFDLDAFFGSALEHGLIEELQNSGLVAASTVKMLELANTNGQPVYLASSANWSTVELDLTNYSSDELSSIANKYINNGYDVLIPQNGLIHLTKAANSWAGYGFEAHFRQANGYAFFAMIIDGDYLGGYDSDSSATASSSDVSGTVQDQSSFYTQTPPFTPYSYDGDPVDMANGTFQVQNNDLSLGQSEPKGITLTRYYNGTRRFSNQGSMTGGWINNYSATANNVPALQACLGGTTPAQAVPMIAATASAIALYNSGTPDPKNMMVTALVAKWAIDQITSSGVSVNIGKDTLQFVQQPDGSFTPPANCTATLSESGSKYTLQERHGNSYSFNASGLLTSVQDPYNNSLAITYNGANNVSTITDWQARKFTFKYNSNGQLTNVTDNSGGGGRSISYSYSTAYNPQGDLTSYTDPDGNTTTYMYDTNHNLTATLDAQNRLVISNLYDCQGRVTAQYPLGDTNKTWRVFWSGWQTVMRDPAGAAQTYFYDDMGRLVSTEDALGNFSQTAYDGQSHIVQTISPLNETNIYFYDGNNNLTESIDPLGYYVQYFYDSSNDLVQTIDPDGNSSSFAYNKQFSVTGQTNGAGDWVNYAYNTDGTLKSSTNSGGSVVYAYDTFGLVNSIAYPGISTNKFMNSALGDMTNHTDARGFVYSYQFNACRQLTNSVEPTNLATMTTYDPEGNVATTQDPLGNVSSETWSALRKLVTTTLPAIAAGTPVISNNYDNRNLLISSLDPLKNPILYTNDLNERLVSQTDPLNRTTFFGYDNDNRKIASTNAANEITSQSWDANGQLIGMIDGAGHTSLRGYDAAGNQIILTNRNGKIWQFYFDGANRLTNTVSPLNRSTITAFNHQGLIASKTDPMGQSATYNYDGKARLTNRTDNVATTLYRYDHNDNQTNIAEAGFTNAWTYDAYNRVSSYKDVNGNLIQYRYDANGNLTNLIYPDGRSVYYSYDSENHMTSVKDWSGRMTAITYDLNGRLATITRPNGTSRTISYDSAGETTNILELMASGNAIAWFRYNWNVAAEAQWEFAAPLPHVTTLPTRTITYDDDNELKTVDGHTVTLDNDGNLLSGPLTNDTFTSYVYDARNRLVSAGGVTNVYDAANYRIGQLYGANSVLYIINPNSNLPETLMRVKNGVTTYYVYGPGLLYQVTENGPMTNTLTYHYDIRGSTVALTSDNGLVTDRMEYSLYATITYHAGNSDTPFLFNGQFGVMTDPNGLLYMQARYYNTFLCRFLNPDPTGFSSGMNFYAYVNGNPVNYTDPLGLFVTADNETDYFDGTSAKWYSDPEVYKTTLKVDVALLTIPAAFFGGEIIVGAGLGVRATLGASAIYGGSLSVMNNTADQLIDNGGNLANVNPQQQLVAGGVGAVFGVGSAGLSYGKDALNDYLFEKMAEAEAPGNSALQFGRLDGMSQAEIDNIVVQSDANVNSLINLNQFSDGTFFVADPLLSDFAEKLFEDRLNDMLGNTSQSQDSQTGSSSTQSGSSPTGKPY